MEIVHPILSVRPEVKGVFMGGCVARGEGSRFRAKAHSHTQGRFVGWICYLSAKWIHVPELALHELAHVLTMRGHDDKWRAKLLEIGGTLGEVGTVLRSYEKKTRGY